MEQFPALYGSWLCIPPVEMLSMHYTDCIRFMPSDSYSNREDKQFKQENGVNVMTYLTSRSSNDTLVNGNESMRNNTALFESFTVDLMGAWSGISTAGLALATAIAVWSF